VRDPADLLGHIVRALPTARDETHRFLEGSASIRSGVANEIFFRQGDLIPLTLMAQGYGIVQRTTADGRELALGVARPGLLCGYSSIAGSPSVDLVAVTPADVATWSGADVRNLVLDDAGLAVDVIDGMARSLVNISDRMDGLIHQAAR